MPEQNRHDQKGQGLNEIRQIDHYHSYINNINEQMDNENFIKEDTSDKSFNNLRVNINDQSAFAKIGSSVNRHTNKMNNKYVSTDMNIHPEKINTVPSHDMSHMKKGIYAQINNTYNNNFLKHDTTKDENSPEQGNMTLPNNSYEFAHKNGYNNKRSVEERKEVKEDTSYMEGGVINNYVELYINKAKEIYYFHVFYNYLKLGWPEKEAAEESKKYIFTTLNNYFAQMKNTIFSSPQFVKRVNKCVASNLLYYQEPTNLHQFLQQLQLHPPQHQSNTFPHEQEEKHQKKKQNDLHSSAQNINMFDFMNLESFDAPASSNINNTPPNYSGMNEINNINRDKGVIQNTNINNNNRLNILAKDNTNNQWNVRDKPVDINDKKVITVEGCGKTNAYSVKEDKIDDMIKGIEEMKRLSEQKKKHTRKRIFSDVPIYEEDKKCNFPGSMGVVNDEGKGINIGNIHSTVNVNNINNMNILNNKNFADSCNNYNKTLKDVPISNEKVVHTEEKKKIRFSINTAQSKIYQRMKINKVNNVLKGKQGQGNIHDDGDNYSKGMGIEDVSEISNISDEKAEERERKRENEKEKEKERRNGITNNMYNINKQFNNNTGIINGTCSNYETNNFQRFDNSNSANPTYEITDQQEFNMYRAYNYERNSYNIKGDMDQGLDFKGNIYYEHNADTSRGNYGGKNNFFFGSINNTENNNNNNINISSSNNNISNISPSMNTNKMQSVGRYASPYGNTRMEKNNRCLNENDICQTNNSNTMLNVSNTYNSDVITSMNEQSYILKEKLKDNGMNYMETNGINYLEANGTNKITENTNFKMDNSDHGNNRANNKIFYKGVNEFGIGTNAQDANCYEYHNNSLNNKYNNTLNNNSINLNLSPREKKYTFFHRKMENENKLDGPYILDNFNDNKNKFKETEKVKRGLYKFTQKEGEGHIGFEETTGKEKGREKEREREREKEKEKEKKREDKGENESDDSDRNAIYVETEMNKKNQIDKKNNNIDKLPELTFFLDKNANVNNQKCYNNYIEKLKFYYKDSLKNKEFGKQFNYFLTCLSHHKNKKDGVSTLWLENMIPSIDNICRANQFIRGLLSKKKHSNEKTNGVLGKSGVKGIVVDPKLKQKIEDVHSKEKRKERFFGGIKSEKGDSNENLFYFDANTNVDKENTCGHNLEKLIEMYDDISCYKNKDFVGQCKSIQKFFFRLTSLPEPKNVRSFSVLKCTYAYILYKYNLDKNYKYTNEQFRSLRQDLNIQSILHTDVINIYETNIRICIVNNDLFQFLQCINKLFEMYQKLNIKKSKVEFLCYKMIYLTLQNMHQEFCQMYFNLTDEERNDENIKLCYYLNDCVKNKMYLINVNMIEPVDNEKNHNYIYSRVYVNNHILNYMKQLMDLSENSVLNVNLNGLSAFIKEHGHIPKTERVEKTSFMDVKNGTYKMPYLANCLIILFLPKYRLLALINICKTSIKVSISTLTKLLNFENDEECLKFLKEVKTDINKNDVLTKPSLTNLLKSPLLKNRYINHIR